MRGERQRGREMKEDTTDPQRGMYLQYRQTGGTKSSESQCTAEQYRVSHTHKKTRITSGQSEHVGLKVLS